MKVATFVGVSGAVAVGSILAYFGYQQYQSDSPETESPTCDTNICTNNNTLTETNEVTEKHNARSVVSDFLKNLGKGVSEENKKVETETEMVTAEDNKVGVWKNFWKKEYQAQDSDKKEDYNS